VPGLCPIGAPDDARYQGDIRRHRQSTPAADGMSGSGASSVSSQETASARCRGYCRMSPVIQADEGESLDMWERQIADDALM
jgi:hypothetical protein